MEEKPKLARFDLNDIIYKFSNMDLVKARKK